MKATNSPGVAPLWRPCSSAMLTISFHSGLDALHHRKIVLNRLTEERFLFEGKRENGSSPH